MTSVFFASPAEFRAWLEEHHEHEPELLVGFYKKASGKPSITWPEAVDEALCFGWIDGVRKRIDESSYSIRFTPRRPRSTWSAVNIARVAELSEQGLMRLAGLTAFAARTAEKTAIYSYEQGRTATLDTAEEQQFRAAQSAWDFFQAQPGWYRRAAIWWVVSAKRTETRHKRLATLIADSERGQTLKHLTRRG